MGQDIRKLFEEAQRLEKSQLSADHEERFLDLLEEKLPQKGRRPSWHWMSIAASVILLIAFGVKFLGPSAGPGKGEDPTKELPSEVQLTLGNISPDLKKVEEYYVNNINYELSQIEVDDENKQLFDSYMSKLTELNDEYLRLSRELNEVGPNAQSVDAMIGNLQLRLKLLYQLQEKLEELKQSKDEQYHAKIS